MGHGVGIKVEVIVCEALLGCPGAKVRVAAFALAGGADWSRPPRGGSSLHDCDFVVPQRLNEAKFVVLTRIWAARKYCKVISNNLRKLFKNVPEASNSFEEFLEASRSLEKAFLENY